MGDFRFALKAEFQMGDFKDKCDMWLNWSACDGDAYPVDGRVIDWLRNCFEKGVEDIRDAMADADEASRNEAARKREDEILAEAEAIRARRQST